MIPIYQLDAFADEIFEGNPAAVCPLARWLPDDLLQRIAAENNLSETAFFVPEGEGFRLRWFTPVVEVEFCGHATLASAYVILSFLERGRERVVFETRRGRFIVERRGDALLMNLPIETAELCDPPSGLALSLGATPAETHRGANLMAVFDDAESVKAMKPDMARLEELCRREGNVGVIATARGGGIFGDCDFVSRFFAPAHGVAEDPVTGSAHCMMGPYWGERLGKDCLLARQISARGGVVGVELREGRVFLEGRCRLYMRGEISLEGAAL